MFLAAFKNYRLIRIKCYLYIFTLLTLQFVLINIEKKATMTLKEWKILENIQTLKDLAKRLNVLGSTNPSKLVHNWIEGKTFPSKKHLNLILAATKGKVTPNDFLTPKD